MKEQVNTEQITCFPSSQGYYQQKAADWWSPLPCTGPSRKLISLRWFRTWILEIVLCSPAFSRFSVCCIQSIEWWRSLMLRAVWPSLNQSPTLRVERYLVPRSKKSNDIPDKGHKGRSLRSVKRSFTHSIPTIQIQPVLSCFPSYFISEYMLQKMIRLFL